jgi:hypothetical protein
MNIDHIEKNIISLYDKAKSLESAVIQNRLEWDAYQQSNNGNNSIDSLLESDDYEVGPFNYYCKQLYNSIIIYLECNKLSSTLEHFHKDIGIKFNEFDATEFNIGIDEPYNVFLNKISSYIDVLGLRKNDVKIDNAIGLMYLERILKSTAVIIARNGSVPDSEPKVYNAVKSILEVIFPSSIHAKGAFFKKAQEYKPDILIPELSVAVEYKYVDNEAKLKATISQISDDVKGYDDEKDYFRFYAVFYVKGDICGVERFKELWKEKNYPSNWKSYYIVGQ